MYNRYVPQPDGSYRRDPHRDQRQQKPQSQHQPPKQDHPASEPCPKRDMEQKSTPPPSRQDSLGLSSFFRQLLPKQLDTSDLLILLLLLLMAGDCEEDKNNALLTMALYFLM